MLVPVLERVFTIAHAYRAEPSVTTRHLTESIQLDLELAFVTFDELMDALEFVGSSTLKYVQEECGDILKEYGWCIINCGINDVRLLALSKKIEHNF